MIKKLIGIIVAVAVIVIVVIAAIRRDNFQSMLLRDEIENQTFPGPVDTDQPAVPAVYLKSFKESGLPHPVSFPARTCSIGRFPAFI